MDFLKVKNIIKIDPEETLSSALSYLGSSHDAAFVFSDTDKFLGVVNPYHCLIKNSHPGNAKVEHCIFHAPRIRTRYSPAKIAQLMIESKVHYLPVFDDQEKFTGIVSARHILNQFRNSKLFNIRIGDFLLSKNQPLVTIMEGELISHAINMFKTRKISKLVVINKDLKLRGIITYYDVINFLVAPRKKGHKGDRKGDRLSFQYQQVKNFSKTYVLTLYPENTLKDAINFILEKEIGSVVVIDKDKHPIGIITTRDFLGLLVRGEREKKIEVIAKNLSRESAKAINIFLRQVTSWTKRIPEITKIRLFVKEEKSGGVFKGILSLIPHKGKPKIIKKEGKKLRDVLKEAEKALKKTRQN